jgi:rare lipoprotein A
VSFDSSARPFTRVALLLTAMCGVLLMSATLSSCAKHKQSRAPVAPPKAARIGAIEKGEASWYGEPYHGRRAASGETFDMEQLTAAHRTLPFQTWVQVTNLNNGKQVDVRIIDRGPFVDGRIIDLSRAAAREIDLLRTGIAPVELRVIEAPQPEAASTNTPPAGIQSPASSSQGNPTGEFAVQAGAFSSRDRAESLRVSLLKVGDARLVPTEATPPLWRVWIGKDLTLDLATKLAEEVKTLTGQAFIVRNR